MFLDICKGMKKSSDLSWKTFKILFSRSRGMFHRHFLHTYKLCWRTSAPLYKYIEQEGIRVAVRMKKNSFSVLICKVLFLFISTAFLFQAKCYHRPGTDHCNVGAGEMEWDSAPSRLVFRAADKPIGPHHTNSDYKELKILLPITILYVGPNVLAAFSV